MFPNALNLPLGERMAGAYALENDARLIEEGRATQAAFEAEDAARQQAMFNIAKPLGAEAIASA